MKLLYTALAAVNLIAFAHANAATLDIKKIPGAYISEVFEVNADTPDADVRSEILVLHADGTAARYQSNSFSASNSTGLELTPSFGTWELDGKKNTVKAVFFDFFDLPPAPCEVPSTPAAAPLDTCANLALEQQWVEYDRITYRIKFHHSKNGKYQRANANALLLGILISKCQTDLSDPTDFGGCDTSQLDTFNKPFLALKGTRFLQSNFLVDPEADLVARNNIKFRRINNKQQFIYPSAP